MSKKTNPRPAVVIALLLLAMGPGIVSGAVIYVDAGAAGNNNGSSCWMP